MTEYFKITQEAITYLKESDERMKEVIEQVGEIKRSLEPDLFISLVSSIVGQQISQKAKDTVWARLNNQLKELTPENIAEATAEDLQQNGLSFRKVSYLKNTAEMFLNGTIREDELKKMSDEEVIERLMKIKGVGKWTAEMQLIFSMERQNVLAFDDFAIKRGLRMIYQEEKITKKFYQKYYEKFSPYATVAGLYIWEVSAGKLPHLKDVVPESKK